MGKLFKREELVTAFDIEGDLIKLAQVSISNSQRLLRSLLVVKSHSSSIEDLAKSIHNLATRFKLSRSLVIVSLPRHMVTAREIKMPSVSQEELEGMVGLQSSKLLPYPKEEIVYSYKVIEATQEGYSRIMLVLTHRDVINRILNIFKPSGIDIHKIALSSEAKSSWYLSRQAAEQKKAPLALIDIDSSSADIQIACNGRVEFTRAITFSPGDKTSRLVDEIRRSFLTYKKELKPDISKLVLTGAESIINQEAPLLKKEFNLPTVYINPLKAWQAAKDSQLPSEEQRKKISFTTVLALAFNFDKLDLNLLPVRVRKMRTARLVKESLFITGLLSFCIILSIVGMIWKKIDDKNDYLRYVNIEIEKTGPRVEELTRMVNNINIIKNQLDMRGAGIDVIRELYSLIPPNVSLTIFDFEEGVACTLRGTADELSSVFKFITILENSAYFNNVKVRYATKRVARKQTLTDFEIVCRLSEH